MVTSNVLNQAHGCWLLSDVIHFIISMNLKLKEENEVVPSFDSLMENDVNVVNELALLASNIKREVYNVLDFFFSFLSRYEKKSSKHNFLNVRP